MRATLDVLVSTLAMRVVLVLYNSDSVACQVSDVARCCWLSI